MAEGIVRSNLMSTQWKNNRKKKFIRPLVMGLGSCIVISGGYYTRSGNNIKLSDAEILKNDWRSVGAELFHAVAKVSQNC